MKLKEYSAELGAALAFIIYWLLSGLIPPLEQFQESFVAVLVILFGFAFGATLKKTIISTRRGAMALAIPDYLAEIITAVVGVLVSILVAQIPDLVPYQTEIVQIVLAILFFLFELVLGAAKGFRYQ